MKRIIILCLFITSNVFAQKIKKISNLELEFPIHEIEEDFGLKIEGNIIPVQLNKKQYDASPKRGSTSLVHKVKMESSQTFDKNLRKVKVSKVTRKGKTTIYNFQYDSQGRLKKYWSVGGRYGDTYEDYSYQNNGNFTRNKSFKKGAKGITSNFTKTNNGYTISGESDKKLVVENNLVKKIIIGYNKAEPSETIQEHNENGRVIKRISSFGTTTYKYNSQGDRIFFKETSKRDGNYTIRKYVYKYDKYGNWVIQVNLLDMSIARGIPSYTNPTLREITYSNGEVTGTTDITKVENDLIALRKKVRNMNVSYDNAVATWKKTSKGNFYFYLDNKAVQKAMLAYMGNDILAFNQDNNKLYLMKNTQNAILNKVYNAKRIEVNTSNGYWFKKPNGGVVVFGNTGKTHQKNTLYKYAPNNIDVFYQGEGAPNKVVLKNYKNAKSYTVYPALDYKNYTNNTIPNTNKNKETKLSGTCLKGDCRNGYGEFKHTNGYKSEGFFKNGLPYGPMHLSNEKKKISTIAFLLSSYQKFKGMQYTYTENRYTELINDSKQVGLLNDAKTRKTYQYNYKNGKKISRTLLKEHNKKTGCIVGNCNNGAGVYKYNNGTFYFGTFQNGKRHGFGKLDFANGNSYIGDFSYGNYEGMGTYIWSESNYYIGEYKSGRYHGQGVMYYTKTNYNAGNWVDGKFTGKVNTIKNNISGINNNSTNKTYNKNVKTNSFNTFSEDEINKINSCNKNVKCISNFMYDLYRKNLKEISDEALTKKMTNYYHSLFNIDPDLAYKLAFKIDYEAFNKIKIKTLPKSIQKYLKDRAQGIINDYNSYIKKQGY